MKQDEDKKIVVTEEFRAFVRRVAAYKKGSALPPVSDAPMGAEKKEPNQRIKAKKKMTSKRTT